MMSLFTLRQIPIVLIIVLSMIDVRIVKSVVFHKYAEMGVCENVETGIQRCAMQLSDCEPTHFIDGEKNEIGEKWYSAYRQKQRGFAPCDCMQTSMGVCTKSLEISDADKGESSSNNNENNELNDRIQCAPHAQACQRSVESFGFLSTSSINSCNCVFNENNPEKRTKYGACQDVISSRNNKDHFCAYSPEDCEGDNHVWIYPEDTLKILKMECFCEEVRIGGCIGGFSNFHCAITEDDCNWDKFYSPISLKEEHGMSCRLCRPSTNDVSNLETDEIDGLKKKGLTAWEISGISILSVNSFAFLVVSLYYYFYKIRGKKKDNTTMAVADGTENKNTEDITGSEVL